MKQDDEAVLKLDGEIRTMLGTDAYYDMADTMDFTKIIGLSGDPRYQVSDEIGECAVYEWPMDVSIRELARAMESTGTIYAEKELPNAIWKSYERLVEKSDAAIQSRQGPHRG